MITLIYCANGNARFAQIAIDAGYRYGAQLPGTVYHPVFFADQNWKKPNRAAYMAALAQHRPVMASVLDWERAEQLPEVLDWAEEAAQFVETVMIIPKVQGGIRLLPRTIGGKPVRLGYSIPTKHGGTALPYSDFAGWPVHLLGGNPHAQMRLSHFLPVASADGNMLNLMAMQCSFWREQKGNKGHWVRLSEIGIDNQPNAPYEAFRRSCENIMAAWKKL